MTTKNSKNLTTGAAADQTDALDIVEASLAVEGGQPQPIELQGAEISIRRNFTGAEAMAYIALFDPESRDVRFDEWARAQLDILSDSDDKALDDFMGKFLEMKVAVADRILVKMGMIAGLRDSAGNFFPGRLT